VTSDLHRWLLRPHPDREAALRLFCVPHAGASATVFHHWTRQLQLPVEVCGIELPGRGARLRDIPYASLDALVAQLVHVLRAHLERPYALYGHSMGGLVAFELARAFRRVGAPSPAAVVVSAAGAPHTLPAPEPRPVRSDADLVRTLERYGGTPAAILAEPDVVSLLLPALRADLALVETYAYVPDTPLDVPLVVLGGVNDALVPPDTLDDWRVHTRRSFTVQRVPGDHFALVKQQATYLLALRERLRPFLASGSQAAPPTRAQPRARVPETS
jgi:surfactin synthase thioesterase subunit